MSFGRVVVGTYGASYDQLLDNGISGFLINPDSAELSTVLRKIWQMDNHQRIQIGECAKKRIELMHPRFLAEELLHYYREVISARRENRLVFQTSTAGNNENSICNS
ncbi:MAG: glycosyltransferase [Planctomycetaceae bacterium]|nr:glycosyltransferase [Planctomycetaceae bacterium]